MNEWWLQEAYLGYRAPVIVNSSPGTVGPQQEFLSPDDIYIFAARLILGIWNYNDIVKSGKLKQEMVRDTPLDMQPYAMILGTHRQPFKDIDKLLHTDDAKHVVIVCNNNFFKLDITDNCGEPVEESTLAASIKDISDHSCIEAQPVGLLTGNPRDKWVEDYRLLKDLGSNERILKDIESSLFLLCLDKELPKELSKNKNNASVRAVQSLTGFSSCTNSGNRWHDKTIQYIVSRDGFIGMEYEHSPCEGVPVAVLHDQVLKYISNKKVDANCEFPDNFPRAEPLKFTLNESLESSIDVARCKVDEISSNIDMECHTFSDFGADHIKAIKQSPDSFIQMAMQVAFYKLHEKPPVHYESAALRRFKDSRTECIRSTSTESVKFATAMTYDDKSMEEKKSLMINAINKHKMLAGQAAMGQGVDRHLFGLRMIARNNNMEIPDIFKDIGYTKSTSFTLTSSQVPYKTASFMCYGPVVPNGYGFCYNPRPKDILFACSSFKSCEDTCTEEFANEFQRALRNMEEIAQS